MNTDNEIYFIGGRENLFYLKLTVSLIYYFPIFLFFLSSLLLFPESKESFLNIKEVLKTLQKWHVIFFTTLSFTFVFAYFLRLFFLSYIILECIECFTYLNEAARGGKKRFKNVLSPCFYKLLACFNGLIRSSRAIRLIWKQKFEIIF